MIYYIWRTDALALYRKEKKINKFFEVGILMKSLTQRRGVRRERKRMVFFKRRD